MPGGIDTPALWLALALVLGGAELVVPGVFLIFLAIAAAVTAAIGWAVPGLPLGAELAAFGVWSAVAVLVGRRWYRDYPLESEDALLNDRTARMIGQVVTVEAAIVGGHGRVRVGDGAWPATGADLPVGERGRVVSVEDGVLVVEPFTPAYPALRDFVLGYFHQDWMILNDNADAVIDDFRSAASGSGRAEVVADLERFLRDHPAGLAVAFDRVLRADIGFDNDDDARRTLMGWLARLRGPGEPR